MDWLRSSFACEDYTLRRREIKSGFVGFVPPTFEIVGLVEVNFQLIVSCLFVRLYLSHLQIAVVRWVVEFP